MELPPILWGMDPLFHVPLQLMICQVKGLTKIPDQDGIYRHHSRTVRSVEIMGLIQRALRKSSHISYTVDDGTGVIQCMIWIPDQYKNIQDASLIPGLQTFQLGQCVRVRGRPNEYLNQIQITVQPGDVLLCTDPNDETAFRLQVLHKEKSVYRQAVVLPSYIMEEAATASEASPRDDVIVHPSRHATTTMLFKAVRKWVSQRQGKEFTFIDIEDEPSISDLAIELVSQDADVHPVHVSARALRMIAGTVQDLIQHGSIEIRDKDRMVLRARARGETLSKVETEVIDLDQETWVQRVSKQEVIDLGDSSSSSSSDRDA